MLSFLRKNDRLTSAVERELRFEAHAGLLSPRQHRLAVEMADNMNTDRRVLRQVRADFAFVTATHVLLDPLRLTLTELDDFNCCLHECYLAVYETMAQASR